MKYRYHLEKYSGRNSRFVCPKCNKAFLINNPNRIPDHKTGRGYRSYGYHHMNHSFCPGSYSQLINWNSFEIEELTQFNTLTTTYSQGEVFKPGDKAVWFNASTKTMTDLIVTKIWNHKFHQNDGRLSNTSQVFIQLQDIDTKEIFELNRGQLNVYNFIKAN